MTAGALIVLMILLFILYHGVPLLQLGLSLLLLAVVGMIAGRLIRGRDYGLLGNIVLGFFGGLFGPFLFWITGLGGILQIPFIGGLIASVAGAIVTVLVLRVVDHRFAR